MSSRPRAAGPSGRPEPAPEYSPCRLPRSRSRAPGAGLARATAVCAAKRELPQSRFRCRNGPESPVSAGFRGNPADEEHRRAAISGSGGLVYRQTSGASLQKPQVLDVVHPEGCHLPVPRERLPIESGLSAAPAALPAPGAPGAGRPGTIAQRCGEAAGHRRGEHVRVRLRSEAAALAAGGAILRRSRVIPHNLL